MTGVKEMSQAQSFTDHDEYLHLGYPRGSKELWKENYYFNVVDEVANVFGVFHFSVRRSVSKAVFTVNMLVDGKSLHYMNLVSWPLKCDVSLSESMVLSDGKLSLEVIHPHRSHRVTFKDDGVDICLNYQCKYPVFFFDKGQYHQTVDVALDVNHYEQTMDASGEIVGQGIKKNIRSTAHRDHTWGFRDETLLQGWNWISALFDDMSINCMQARFKSGEIESYGYVSTGSGNRSIKQLIIDKVNHNGDGVPEETYFTVITDDGEEIAIVACTKQRLVLPMNRERTSLVYENFSEFVIEKQGLRGIGIDEHMVNVKPSK